ncbi:MAG: MarR family winged helix-turn-helix transcriptional regulator [Woeseiaceae bacterium]
MRTDFIDRLIDEWEQEAPQLDTAPMQVIGRVVRLGRDLNAAADKALAEFDLSYTEFDILATLRRSGQPYQLTPGALQASVLLTSGAMTAALNRLTTRNLITRESDADDKRIKAARLTVAGSRLALKAARHRFAVAAHQTSSMSAAKLRQLESLLRELGN